NQQCAKEYGDSLAKYPADSVAHNQRAACLVKLRDMKGAMDEMQQAVKMLPNHAGYRTNLALLAAWAGDFGTTDAALQKLSAETARSLQARAYSQMGRGLLRETAETYEKLGKTGPQGMSAEALGLGDIDVYKGRFADAVKRFDEGAAGDLMAKFPDRA